MSVEFAAHQRLSILIHALSKVGKSTLSATAPKPILVLDAEGSWRFIPTTWIAWDPNTGPPPTYDGSWETCVVNISEWRTIELVYQWLVQSATALPFVSVVLDSISEVQRRCRSNLKGTEAMRIQDWGVLLTVMDKVIRGFRDLTLMPQSSVRCVVFVAETRATEIRQHDGRVVTKQIPYMQGQIATSLPYWVDVVGYLLPDRMLDANGQPTEEIRRLHIGPHPQFESGARPGQLGDSLIIRKPHPGQIGTDITDWMCTVYGVKNTVE